MFDCRRTRETAATRELRKRILRNRMIESAPQPVKAADRPSNRREIMPQSSNPEDKPRFPPENAAPEATSRPVSYDPGIRV
jgi:hypothetical protein